MIIRNPYNFIAKHYKLINLLLLIPMIYIAFCFSDAASFFNSYVKQSYTTPETNITNTYLTGLVVLAIIVFLVANIIMYFILNTKKKKSLHYLACIIYSLILLFGVLLLKSAMSSIEKSSLDATFANFIRDCSFIFYIPIYPLIIVNITKGLGFNVRTLKFDNNSDLKLRDEDEEDDIEIRIGSENNSLKRNIVHLLRELKYYILENKFVFCCIGGILAIIIVYNLYLNFQVYNKTYAINQSFSLDNFTLSIKDSYLTNVDYSGNIITEGKYYLAIKIGLENLGEDTALDKSSFRIYINNEAIFPSYDKASRFLDIGEPYQGQTIYSKYSYNEDADESETSHDYVFVYELTEDQIKSSYQMRILNGLSQKNTKLIKSYKKITIKPNNLIKSTDLGELELSKEYTLNGTMLEGTIYKLNGIEIASSYSYKYEKCSTNGDCVTMSNNVVANGGKALLIIDDDITWDESLSYYKNGSKDFYTDFVKITYEYTITVGRDSGEKTNTITLTNVTPTVLKDKKIYEVPYTMLSADKIIFNITIRDKQMSIIAKG